MKRLHQLDPQLRVEWDGRAQRWSIYREIGGWNAELKKFFPQLNAVAVGQWRDCELYRAHRPRVWIGFVQQGNRAGGPFADLSNAVIDALRRRSQWGKSKKEIIAEAKKEAEAHLQKYKQIEAEAAEAKEDIKHTIKQILTPKVFVERNK